MHGGTAGLAQSVERQALNLMVEGSSPSFGVVLENNVATEVVNPDGDRVPSILCWEHERYLTSTEYPPDISGREVCCSILDDIQTE